MDLYTKPIACVVILGGQFGAGGVQSYGGFVW